MSDSRNFLIVHHATVVVFDDVVHRFRRDAFARNLAKEASDIIIFVDALPHMEILDYRELRFREQVATHLLDVLLVLRLVFHFDCGGDSGFPAEVIGNRSWRNIGFLADIIIRRADITVAIEQLFADAHDEAFLLLSCT